MADRQTPQLGRKPSSRSVPSSPDLGNRRNTPINDGVPSSSSNCSSPLLSRNRARFSFYSQSSDNTTRPKKKGFLRIFKWFRKRGKSKDSAENSSTVTSGSVTSLTSTGLDPVIVPLSRSKSADNQRGLAKSLKKSDTIKSVQLPASLPGTPVHGESSSKPVVSYTNIEEISDDLRLAASGALRKRTAPQPPESPDYSQVVMRNNMSGSNSTDCRLSSGDSKNPFISSKRYSSSDNMNPFYSNSKRNSMESTNSIEGRTSRTSNDSGLYARTKRKAPQPPVTNWTSKVQQLSQSKDNLDIPNAESAASTTTRTTPESGVSSADIGEPPSQSSTLRSSSSQSSSTLRGSISSRCSGESLRLEKGFLKQDLQSNAGSVSRSDSTSNSPNPRPWYKRKKKSKPTKKTEKLEPIDQVYEYWRPEIQFSEGKIASGTNKSLESPTATSEKSSIKKKVIEVCKPKRTSQVSLLASISQLDQEAVEQLRKEKEEIKAAKNAYDESFYKKTGPHILTQLDVSGNSPGNSPKVRSNRNCTGPIANHYDNFEANNVNSENRLSYSKQATLKIGDTQQLDKTNENNDHTVTGSNRLVADNLKSWPVQQFSVTASSSSSTASSTTVASTSSNQSLLQQANLDAELFYQLAKDVRHTPELKSKNQPVDSSRPNRKGSTSSLESDSDQDSSTPRLQRQIKNFGMRMNQLFTPDVSVILEASESVTSSTTTPADEALNDLNSCVTGDTNEMIYQDVSERGDIMSENRFTSVDAREIMKELADVKQEIERINEEESQDQLQREINKAEKIQQEVRMLRDRDNFSIWQDMLTGSSRNNASPGIPLPIDIVTSKPELKLKWVCDTCTLINLPWRITCEACSSRRPTQPTRIKDDGTRVSPAKDGSNNSGSSHHSNSDGSPLTVIQGEDNTHNLNIESNTELELSVQNNSSNQDGTRQRTNWESELKHYFEGSRSNQPDWNRSSNQQGPHILFNRVKEESSYGKINVISKSSSGAIPKSNHEEPSTASAQSTGSTNINSPDPNLDEIRRARVEKFEQGIRSFEAMIRGTSENTAASSNNQERRDENDRPIANQIDTMLPQFNSTDKVFYSKGARKRPVVQTVGAVKSTISIFNQKEQLDQAKKGKVGFNKQVRRKSVGLIKGQATLFENMQAEANHDLNRRKSFTKEYPRPKATEKPPEIDISSAISKFDELAAMAEVERLNPRLVRSPFSKKPKRFIIHPKNIVNGSGNINGNNSRESNPDNTMEAQENPAPRAESDLGTCAVKASKTYQDPVNDVENETQFEAEPMIMDGVLYTSVEGNGRAMSIVSSTFELIHETEFEEIEAEHSQRGSPTSEYEDAFQPGYDSDGTENYVDAIPGNFGDDDDFDVSVGEQLSGMEINRCAEDQQDDDYMSTVQETTEDTASSEMTELERLSQQLTLTRGIANFKASLEAESSHLSRSSTLDISRLLKKLEAAIARGDHAEAGHLARELASLKVTCSVTHAQGGNSEEQGVAQARNQNGVETSQEDTNRPKKPENARRQLTSDNKMAESVIKPGMALDENQNRDGGLPRSEPPVINIELMKEQTTSTTVHLAVQPCHPQQNIGREGKGEETVHMRENKSTLNRREVKSDNVSRLVESSTSVSAMPSIIENFNVQMYVEDRASHQGPIDVSVNASMTVGELRSKVYVEFGFPPEVQRWILGRRLADDDRQTLAQHRVTTEGCPVFLYLVAPRSSARRDSRPLADRRNSETLQSPVLRPKAMPPRQLSADGASSSGSPRLMSPSITKPAYDRSAAVVRPSTERLAQQNSKDAEDPIKGNELIRQQEELDMRGDNQFHRILQSKGIPVKGVTKPDSQFASSNLKPGRPVHPPNVSLTRRDETSKPAQSSSAAIPTSSLENSVGIQKSTSKFAGTFSKSLAEGNRVSEPQECRDRRGNEGKIIIKLTEQDPASNLRVSVTQSPQSKRKIEQRPVNQLPLFPSSHDSSRHNLVQARQGEADKPREEDQRQIPVQHQGNAVRQQQHQNQTTQQLLLRKELTEQPNETLKQRQIQAQSVPGRRLNPELQVQNATSKPKSPVSVRKTPASQKPTGAMTPSKSDQLVLQNPRTNLPKVTQDDKKQPPVISRGQQSPRVARKATQPSTASSNDKTSPGQRSASGLANQPISAPPPTNTPASSEGWSCPRCTLVNPIQRPGCEACATERPSEVEVSPATIGQGQQSHLSRAMSALETEGAVGSRERFECRVCFTDVPLGRGVVLRDCLHSFCRECLADAVRYSDTAEVKCPYRDDQYSCDASLQDREVKELVSPAEYEKHLNKSVKQAAGSMQNVFHCKTPDCRGFCVYEDNVNVYLCTVCYKQNCLTCQAQHAGQSCRQYQQMVSLQQDIASVKTQKFFEDMIRRGDGLPCPHCSVMLVRKWGCDWMRCPMCRTEICWVTRGPRWGPKGIGDTSGGCQCGIKGRKCHPKCTYCH